MSEEEARQLLERLRWPEGVYCAHCGSTGVTKLEGSSHRPGLYQCKDCRKQFTVTVGTIMHRSRLPLVKWIMAFYLMCSSKKGVSALQIKRQLGLGSYKTAWHLCHRVRHAMQNRSRGLLGIAGGVVEVDETYIGGKPRRGEDSKQGRGTIKKTPVVAVVDRNGDVMVQALDDVTGDSLKGFVQEHVDPSAHVYTDGFTSYRGLDKHFASHEVVNHSDGEFARDGISVNLAESFFSLVKRQHYGQHHHYSRKHMNRYVNETAFRWGFRGVSDWVRTVTALRRGPGARLMYQTLVG